MSEEFLQKKLDERHQQHAFRRLRLPENKTDFCSNDYLGLARMSSVENGRWQAIFNQFRNLKHGSAGSRLLAGNYALIEETETMLAEFHQAPAALICNSGYDANIGLLSAVLKKGDTVIYDYLSHASLRDGIRLSFAKAFSFRHNDLDDLEKKLQSATGNIFVVTESVFSMDGDQAPLAEMATLCERYQAHLVVDEAHATGIIGRQGAGLVQLLGLQSKCFARIHTFGKAVGCHGAVILGSERLRQYLINFSRSFIYTTALPESSVAAIRTAYTLFPAMQQERDMLQQLIMQFRNAPCSLERLNSETAIQVVIIPGNDRVKQVAASLQQAGLDVRAVLYPTVPEGRERLRIVLHAYNTPEEVDQLLHYL